MVNEILYWSIYLPPATKLGQSNVFTSVCNSVNGGGCAWSQGGVCSGGVCSRGVCSRGVSAPGGCLLPGGVCSWGCLLLVGVCSGGVIPGGAWWRPPPGRPLLRAVRILLEYILVICQINLIRHNRKRKNNRGVLWNVHNSFQSLLTDQLDPV